MKKTTLAITLAVIVLGWTQCNETKKGEETTTNPEFIIPVPLPDPGIPGFKFPEDSVVITDWVNNREEDKMASHSWGIWAALTSETKQVVNGQNLLAFETWLTPEDMQKATKALSNNKELAMESIKVQRGRLERPRQFFHNNLSVGENVSDPTTAQHQVGVMVTVRYSPTASSFTIKNKLLEEKVLKQMLADGKTSIPDFPNTAITLKPTYEVLSKDTLDKNSGYYKLNVWTGAPADDSTQGYGEGSWPGYVYVDPNNNGQGNGSVDMGQGRTPENTYNLKDFIYYKLTKDEAKNLDSTFNADIREGDPVILVAMHVTSKEIKRWTWQSFWWAPDANTPPDPSSAHIASLRPSQLQGAASHYAMSYAYTFLYPNQPYVGGDNKGTSIYAYNPYLEAGFAVNNPLAPAYVMTNGVNINNSSGVRTNCMTCHANANYPGTAGTPGYMGDTYIDLRGADFKNTLQLDFAWSIQGNLIPDK